MTTSIKPATGKTSHAIHLAAAAKDPWDVVVIGAGPGGSLIARQLALRGHSVLLVDRASFPRWKVCGCCLNERCLSILEHSGLGTLVDRQGGVRLHRFELAGWHRRAGISLPGGVALSREAFDTALVQAAIQAGAVFLSETLAVLQARPGSDHNLHPCDVRSILLVGEAEVCVRARVVIAANGLGGQFAHHAEGFKSEPAVGSRVGAGVQVHGGSSEYQAGTIYMAVARAGYLGLVRLEDGRLNLAAAIDANQLRRAGSPGLIAKEMLEDSGLPAIDCVADLPWRGTPALTRRASWLAAERVFALGDAAGFVEPFTGEGISWSLAAAEALTPLASQAVHCWVPSLEHVWSVQLRRLMTKRQFSCRIVAALLRHPTCARIMLEVLARIPMLASPLVRRVNAPDRRR